jgi:triacylglycerol lipase
MALTEQSDRIPNPSAQPVVLVHGIWDSATRLSSLTRGLCERGLGPIVSFDLLPNDGRATIEQLAQQLHAQVESACAQYACARVDLVGFSMGALIARYYVQRGDGKTRVRRFVSISGPHAGTWTAYALPLPGARQMRPDSQLLRELASDHDPWGDVAVYCLYTAFDLTILPANSSVLAGVKQLHKVNVLVHRWMISDPRVFDHIADALR